MKLAFIVIAVVFCGVCSAVPTEVASASAVATTGTDNASAGGSSKTESASAVATAAAGSTGSSGADGAAVGSTGGTGTDGASAGTPATGSAPAGGSAIGGFDIEDDSEDDDEFGFPLSSALLLSSQHGHHVCLPDVLAYSLLGNLHGYPLAGFFPIQHTASQRLQQELSFLKAFTKAGQQVWKAISTGHGKAVHHSIGNFEKVTNNVENPIGGVTGGL